MPESIDHCYKMYAIFQMRKFLLNGASWLPRHVRMLFQQYSTEETWFGLSYELEWRRGWVQQGWSVDRYNVAVKQATDLYLKGYTPTYWAIYHATN